MNCITPVSASRKNPASVPRPITSRCLTAPSGRVDWRGRSRSETSAPASIGPSDRRERSRSMPIYVSLINWTDQGIKNFRDTVHRAEDFRGLVQKNGGQVRQILWTLGEYDVLGVVDFPDDETATATLLQLGALGNVRTTTMRAFDAEQMTAIIQRTG